MIIGKRTILALGKNSDNSDVRNKVGEVALA